MQKIIGLALCIFLIHCYDPNWDRSPKKARPIEPFRYHEDQVLTLTDETFEENLIEDKYFVVIIFENEFPFLDNQLEQLAYARYNIDHRETIYKEIIEKMVFGSLKQSQGEEMIKQYKIKSFPALIFFYEGVPYQFTERVKEPFLSYITIQNFLMEQIIAVNQERWDAVEITHKTELMSFLQTYHVVLVYFGKQDQDSYRTFTRLKNHNSLILFVTTNETELLEDYNIENGEGLILFSTISVSPGVQTGYDYLHSPQLIYTGNWSLKNLQQWVQKHKLPFFFEMNPRSFSYLYRHPEPFFMLFIENSFSSDYLTVYEKCAEQLDYEIPLSYCETSHPNEFCKKLIKQLNIHEGDVPVLYILENLSKLNLKYKMNIGIDIKCRNVVEFFQAHQDKELIPHYKSEEVPLEQGNDFIKKIVGSNFKSMVITTQYDSIVLFDGDNCHQCKVLFSLYEETAKQMRNNHKVKFFIINTSKNDGETFKEVGQNSIVLYYTARDKTKPVNFSQIRHSKIIVQQIKKYTSQSWVQLEEQKIDL